MPPLHITVLVPIVALVAVLGTDAWVYSDATNRLKQGDRVMVSLGTLRIQTPEVWFLACLVLWVVFLPMYLTVTDRNPFGRRNT